MKVRVGQGSRKGESGQEGRRVRDGEHEERKGKEEAGVFDLTKHVN